MGMATASPLPPLPLLSFSPLLLPSLYACLGPRDRIVLLDEGHGVFDPAFNRLPLPPAVLDVRGGVLRAREGGKEKGEKKERVEGEREGREGGR